MNAITESSVVRPRVENPHFPIASVLRWAVGGSAPPPDLEVDADQVLVAAWRHKLTGRLHDRLRAQSQPWAADELVAELAAQVSAIERGWAARLAQIRAVAAVARDAGVDFCVVKGVTSYAVTGDERLKRRSNDVDVLPDDPDRMIEALTASGYTLVDEHCRGHEYASLYDPDGLNLDLHSHFPVIAGADGFDDEPARPHAHPGFWHGFRPLRERRIGFAALAELSTRGRAPGSEVARFPDVTAAAFVATVHTMREFSHVGVVQPYATVRLADVHELDRLLRHPRFDRARFDALVRRFDGATSVAFCDHLRAALLGGEHAALLRGHRDEREPVFPFDLYIDGFAISDARAADTDGLLVRRSARPIGDLVEWLGANAVSAVTGAAPPHRLATAERLAGSFERVLVQGKGVDAEVGFRWDRDALRIELLARAGGDSLTVLFQLDDVFHELLLDAETATFRPLLQRHTARDGDWVLPLPLRVERLPGAWELAIELPWQTALEGVATGAPLDALLALRWHHRDGAPPADAVLVPLRLAPAADG